MFVRTGTPTSTVVLVACGVDESDDIYPEKLDTDSYTENACKLHNIEKIRGNLDNGPPNLAPPPLPFVALPPSPSKEPLKALQRVCGCFQLYPAQTTWRVSGTSDAENPMDLTL